MKKIVLKKNEILVLRNVRADMTSKNGFAWPRKGRVVARDWRDTDKCGNGLHGLPWGCGSVVCFYGDTDAVWVVVRVSTLAGGYQHGTGEMGDKCKFRSGEVVFAGNRDDAVALIQRHAPNNSLCVYSTLTGGDYSTLMGGNWSTLTGGYRSTLMGGNWSTLTGGNWSTLTGGNWSTLTGGYMSTLMGGNWSTLMGGYGSTLTGGYGSTLTGGDNGTVAIQWWDDKKQRYRIAIGYVGEGGIKPNKPYCVRNGKLVLAEKKQ